MAERGLETLRHGPMKPFGLTNPHQPDNKPYAVVQLRQDNKLGTLFNMVGFQTKLKHGEQVRIFRTIPGLQNAEFARLGGLHRNTFLNSPNLLDEALRLKANPRWRFAGQITGCEGYVESAAVGLLAGRFAAAERRGEPVVLAAADDGAWRTARPHYRWSYRDDRCGPFIVPADERQLRFVSTVKRGSNVRSPQQIRAFDCESTCAQKCADPPRSRRSRALDRRERPRGCSRMTAMLPSSGRIWQRARYAIAAAKGIQQAGGTDRNRASPYR